MKNLLCLVVMLLVASTAFADVSIPVANHSFETPIFAAAGDASANWSDQEGTGVDVITGWNLDNAGANIGVWYAPDSQVASPDGSDNVSYVVNGETAGPWQDLGYTIVAGETYAFSMDVQRNSNDQTTLAIGLAFNYHDAGVRAEIIKESHDISGQASASDDGEWVTYDVEFTAVAGDAWVGKSLGIEFTNDSSGSSWHHFDNAVVPEPATMILLGLGGLFLRRRK